MRKPTIDKPYSKMTKKEKAAMKRTIATQNKKLANLEKKGLASSSAAYRYIEGQYAAGANWLYKNKAGQIRFRGDISKMSADTLSQTKYQTKAYRKAQTSTTTGTKQYKTALESGYNKFLQSIGVNRTVKAKEIKEIHESRQYKTLQGMYGSGDAVKIIEYAKMTGNTKYLSELIDTSKLSPENKFTVDQIQKLFGTHKEYEVAARGIRGVTQKELSELVSDYAVFDLMQPEEFNDIVQGVARHRERGERIKDLVEKELQRRY